MLISREGKAELGSYEGCILTPYLDSVNVKTIAFGSTKSDIPDIGSWPWTKEITIQEAADMLTKHVVKYENAVNAALRVDVEQHQFDALVSFVYNLGVGITKGSLFQAINTRQSLAVIGSKFMLYNRAGGKVLKGLTNRRRNEAILYKDGYYSSDGIIPLNKAHPVTHKEIITGKQINLLDYI